MRKALVLEGGSLRSMFSAAVLDFFLEQDLKFNGSFGSSAGSLTLISYIAGQYERTKRVNLNFAQEKEYLGFKSFFKYKSVFNFDYMFNEISDVYIPLDRKEFETSACDFTATATNCRSGQTAFYNKNSCPNIYKAVSAGSSMPLLSPIVDVFGEPCLDGGITNAVPYQKAIDEGYDKIVVVLTREHGFLKKNTPAWLARLYTKHYHQYPNFVRALIDTPRMYANQMNEIDRLEYEGKIFVIRPQEPITVSRMETNTTKLLELYETGYQLAENRFAALQRYLEN